MLQQISAAAIAAAFAMGRHNGEVPLRRQACPRRMANMTLRPCRA